MIISDKSVTNYVSKARWRHWLVFLILIGTAFIIFWWYFSTRPNRGNVIGYCNAEHIRGDHFYQGGKLYVGAQTQSGDIALSGKYSSKIPLGVGLQYGIGYDFLNFEEGQTYRISIWRYLPQACEAFLAVSAGESNNFYEKTSTVIEKTADGWDLLQLVLTVPFKQDWQKIDIHTFTEGNCLVYFDDLRIEKIKQSLSDQEKLGQIALFFKDEAMRNLNQKRTLALKNGILEGSEEDWVKAKLIEGDSTSEIPVEARLKGDWLDHLQPEKWSFRVKVRDPYSWRRLKTFSLHTPAVRHFLHEWVFHQLLEQEDILTTRYDFIELKVNDKSWGLYAFEEHFDKYLVEYKRRREGPIVKFSEEGFWANFKRQYADLGYITHDIDQPVRRPEKAEIRPFNEKQTLLSPVLKTQFERAGDLMYQYMNGLKQPSEIFDVERLAKYFAICDVLGALHGIVWHNQRFYYNPVIDRLEPIGFDGFTEPPGTRYTFLGQGATHPFKSNPGDLLGQLFQDTLFTATYVKNLYHYTDPMFLSGFFESIAPALSVRKQWMRREFPDYTFDQNKMIHQAQFIRTQLIPYPQSVKAYLESQTGDLKRLKVTNIHTLPVRLVGYGVHDDAVSARFEDQKVLPAQPPRMLWLKTYHLETDRTYPEIASLKYEALQALEKQEGRNFYTVEVPVNAKYLYFNVLGIDSLIAIEIFPWRPPVNSVPSAGIHQTRKLQSNSIYVVDGSSIIFRKGRHQVPSDIIIPAGFNISMGEGVELDFVKGAKFLSFAPVAAFGSDDFPIKIFSSDKSGRGFTILKTQIPSKLSFVWFDQLTNFSEGNWTMTGAVNFYEAPVELYRCHFTRNNCEDALNIIRSEFEMRYCKIANTSFDGFDCDFCIGEVKNSRFLEIGNDGMDFSGSQINVWNCEVQKTGDKGISVGEESEVAVFDTQIKNCPIGVASKDLSMLVLENMILKDCVTGYAAYQKKPEFGPAKIIAKSSKETNVKQTYNLSKGSSIQLETKLITGN